MEFLSVDNLESVGGDFIITYNAELNFDGTIGGGLANMPAFDALTTIGGDVQIDGNQALAELDAFHSVTEIKGTSIKIEANAGNDGISLINIFNGLVNTGSETTNANIYVFDNTDWFSGFAALENANNIDLNLYPVYDQMTWMYGDLKVDGFDALTETYSLRIWMPNVTEFNAFSSLDNFKSTGTYLKIFMPYDSNVGFCSMEPILTKIKNGDFDGYSWTKAEFYISFNTTMDRDLAIDQLLAPCAP